MKSLGNFAVLVAFCLLPQVGFAQTEQAEPEPSSILVEAENELTELFSQRALDFSSTNQETAISILRSLEVKSDRFNEPTLAALQAFSSGDNTSSKRLRRALELMDVGTLSEEARVDAMLDCFVRCDKLKQESIRRSAEYPWLVSTQRTLSQRLGRYWDQTYANVLARMQKSEEDYPISLLQFVSGSAQKSEQVLAIVMKTARSEDEERADEAMMFAVDLVRTMKSEVERARNAASPKDLEGIGAKFVGYAKRIVARYDANKDGLLSEPEYAKMLQSPIAADENKDGHVSVPEYARWMMNRTKRN